MTEIHAVAVVLVFKSLQIEGVLVGAANSNMARIIQLVESWNLEETHIRLSFRRGTTFISPAPATPVHFTGSSILVFSAINRPS